MTSREADKQGLGRYRRGLLVSAVVFWFLEASTLAIAMALALAWADRRYTGVLGPPVAFAAWWGATIETLLYRLRVADASGQLPSDVSTANALRGGVYAIPPFVAMCSWVCLDWAGKPALMTSLGCAISLIIALTLTYRIYATWRQADRQRTVE